MTSTKALLDPQDKRKGGNDSGGCWPTFNLRIYLCAVLILLLIFTDEQPKQEGNKSVRAAAVTVTPAPTPVPDMSPAHFCKECKWTEAAAVTSTCGDLVEQQVAQKKDKAKATAVIASMYGENCCKGTGASDDPACPPKIMWDFSKIWANNVACHFRAQYLADTYGMTRDQAQIALMLNEPEPLCTRTK